MYKERDIFIRIFIYKDDGFDLHGNTLADMNCSFLTGSEMQQRFYTIGTDSYKSDQEVVDYYVAGMQASGICIHSYEIIEMPMSITSKSTLTEKIGVL